MLLLDKIDGLVSKREDFAFETTLSGLGYVRRIQEWRLIGYSVVLYFLKLPSEEMAIERVHLRVAEGGHNVPERTIRRRYHKGWKNLNMNYKQVVDAWVIFDNSGKSPVILDEST
ncbi:MAG: zeta toxin family protein [Candidatus Thiosymbion ectosymbiont of Robbea hypermnestra]|nr:zeta toxin family protein [Candidatus Thiosymbion ectosymbiont of Robbea hypermnestra]